MEAWWNTARQCLMVSLLWLITYRQKGRTHCSSAFLIQLQTMCLIGRGEDVEIKRIAKVWVGWGPQGAACNAYSIISLKYFHLVSYVLFNKEPNCLLKKSIDSMYGCNHNEILGSRGIYQAFSGNPFFRHPQDSLYELWHVHKLTLIMSIITTTCAEHRFRWRSSHPNLSPKCAHLLQSKACWFGGRGEGNWRAHNKFVSTFREEIAYAFSWLTSPVTFSAIA